MVSPEFSHALAGGLPMPVWQLISRLGEAQILLPALLVACGWLAWRGGARALALWWLGGTVLAAALTTATKVAFIGYGIGLAALDFTGISGHAMFSAAILPLLLRLAEGSLPARWHGAALWVGYALAALVAWSRLVLGAHSVSEVVAGFTLGALASGLALQVSAPPRLRLGMGAPLLLLLWATTSVGAAPPSRTHDWVTQLALASAGRSVPYQRWHLHRPPLPPPASASTGALLAAGLLQPR